MQRASSEARMAEPLGFVGVGTIGNPMAERLLGAGHALVVHDVRREAAASLEARGARWSASAREVAAACRVVFTSLPGPREIEAVALGADGLLAGARPGDVHVDLSTSSLAAVRALAAAEARAGVALVDAPVSGGAHGARQGTLAVMASGERTAFERVQPLFDAFAKRVFFLGESGNGTLAKLVNNQIFLCAGLLLQEGFVLAAKAGLDAKTLLEVVRASSAASYAGLADLTFARSFDQAFFTLALAEKDVSLALASAQALGVPMPVTSAAHGTYARAASAGLGAKSFLATLLAIEEAAGTRVSPLAK
jgi:3-hydroxyisobutyrate dehydrogenase-like beta-hydroxyacid dehydrogenase